MKLENNIGVNMMSTIWLLGWRTFLQFISKAVMAVGKSLKTSAAVLLHSSTVITSEIFASKDPNQFTSVMVV